MSALDTTTSIIIDVQLGTADAKQRAIDITNQMIALKDQQDKLRASGGALSVGYADISRQLSMLGQQQKAYLSLASVEATSNNAKVAQLKLLTNQINLLTDYEKKYTDQGKLLISQAAQLKEELTQAGNQIGNFTGQVGNYKKANDEANNSLIVMTKNLNPLEKAFERVTNPLNIGARVLTQFSRQIIGLGTGVLSGFIGAKAIEALTEYIAKLDIFSPKATEAVLKQETFDKALESADYSKAIEELDSLNINIDLAKRGFLDKDRVVDQYNESIGRLAGNVDTLDEAEKGIVKNGEAFIKITLLKQVAQLALADAAKKAYEAAQIANKPPTPFGGKDNNGSFDGKAPEAVRKYYEDLNKAQEARHQKNIKDAEDEGQKYVDIAKKTAQIIADINKQMGFSGSDITGKGGQGISQEASLRNQIANQDLESQKAINQRIIDNEKLTLAQRLQAVKDYYAASQQIIKNNENIALSDKTLSKNQQLLIEKKAASDILVVQDEAAKKEQALTKENDDLQRRVDQDRAASLLITAQNIVSVRQKELDDIKDNIAKRIELYKKANRDYTQLYTEQETRMRTLRDKFAEEDLSVIAKNVKEAQEIGIKSGTASFGTGTTKQQLASLQNADDNLDIDKQIENAKKKTYQGEEDLNAIIKSFEDKRTALNDAYAKEQLTDQQNANNAMLDEQMRMQDATYENDKALHDAKIKLNEQLVDSTSSAFGAIAEILGKNTEAGKVAFAIEKGLAIAKIIINSEAAKSAIVLATNNAIAAASEQAIFDFGFSLGLIPGIIATGAAQEAAITSQEIEQTTTIAADTIATLATGKARGGYIQGPGTGTSDSIPARLSNGEFVMTAKATKMFAPLLSDMNVAGGGVPFAVGGLVGGSYVPTLSGHIEDNNAISRAVVAGISKLKPTVYVEDINYGQSRMAVNVEAGNF